MSTAPAVIASPNLTARQRDYFDDLCQRFELRPKADDAGLTAHYLTFDGHDLALESPNGKGRVSVHFDSGKNAHRLKFGGGQGQDIAKAVGVSAYKPSVCDATAGLGRDAFVLASLGCEVTLIERQPVIAALLFDGLNRARHSDDETVRRIAQRMRFIHAKSHDVLAEHEAQNTWDIVYLDPMFPHDPRAKAQVKKDMQAFRDVVGEDDDGDALLDHAKAAARCRVVVKRGRKSPPLAGRAPTYDLVGKSNRFDVYVNAKVTPRADALGG